MPNFYEARFDVGRNLRRRERCGQKRNQEYSLFFCHIMPPRGLRDLTDKFARAM